MTNVTIIYYSGTGNSKLMAEAVLRGVNSVVNVHAELIAIEGKDIIEGRWANEEKMKKLDAADAIIFGTPTYMGSISAQLKTLFDATVSRYLESAWKDKIAAGFTVSAAPAGDKLNSLMTMVVFAMQMGMIWIGLGNNGMNGDGINRLGTQVGVAGQGYEEPPSEDDLKTGEHLGKRIAEKAVDYK